MNSVELTTLKSLFSAIICSCIVVKTTGAPAYLPNMALSCVILITIERADSFFTVNEIVST